MGVGKGFRRGRRKAENTAYQDTGMSEATIMTATDGKLVLALDKSLYPLDVIYGAAYVFIDRAYILLGRDGENITVELACKDEDIDEAALRAMAMNPLKCRMLELLEFFGENPSWAKVGCKMVPCELSLSQIGGSRSPGWVRWGLLEQMGYPIRKP